MAGSLGSLVVSLEANIARFTSDMGRAAHQTEQAMNRMDRSTMQTQRAMASMQNAASLASAALVGMMAGLSVQKLVQYSDSWTNIESRIKLVTTSSAQLASVQGQLFDIAQRNRSDMNSTVALYTRLAQSSDTLGASQKEMIKFTEGVSAAVLLSGAGTQEAAGALQQLSQAMSNANIQAQEYNSINDGAPEILRAVARNIQGVDGDLGKLRAKMLAGGLSSKEFFAAFMKDTDSLAAKSQGMALTVGQAYTKLNNEAMKFVGEASKSSGAGQMMAGTIDTLSKNLDVLAAGIGGLMTYKMSEWTLLIATSLVTKANAAYTAAGAMTAERVATIAAAESTVASTAATVVAAEAKAALIAELRVEAVATLARTNAVMQSTLSDAANALAMQSRAVAMAELAALGRAQVAVQAQITASTVAATAAQTALNAATVAGAGASGLAARALGFIGGPIGAVTAVLGLGAAAWMYWGKSAEDSSKKAASAVKLSTEDIIADMDAQIKKIEQRNALANAKVDTGDMPKSSAAAEKMGEIQLKIDGIRKKISDGDVSAESGITDVNKLLYEQGKLRQKIAELAEKNKPVAADNSAVTAKYMAEYANKEEKLQAKLKEIRSKYSDGIIPPEIEKRARAEFAEKTPKPKKPIKTVADKIEDTNKSMVDDLRRQEGALGLTGAALLKYEMIMDGVPEAYQRQAMASQTAIDGWNAEAEAEKKRADAMQQAADDAAQAAQQNAANVEQIRVDLMSEVEQEQLAHEARLDELRRFGAAKLDTEANINATIEAEHARHEQAKADRQASYNVQSLAMAGDAAGQLYGLMQKAGKEQSALGRALFLVSKALAVAEIILSTEVAAAKAGAQLGIFGIPMALMIRATGYASAGMVAGMAIAEVSGAREKGGAVWDGGAFMVGEKGPEIFKPPSHGTIIPNSKIGGGGEGMKFTIVNQTTGRIDNVIEQRISDNERALIIQESVAATAAQMSDPNSKTSRAMGRNFNVPRTR